MATQEELRIVLKTIAETAGASQTSQALRNVQAQGQQTQRGIANVFDISRASALRFAAGLTGVQLGLSALGSDRHCST
jgi:hypothetical protein